MLLKPDPAMCARCSDLAGALREAQDVCAEWATWWKSASADERLNFKFMGDAEFQQKWFERFRVILELIPSGCTDCGAPPKSPTPILLRADRAAERRSVHPGLTLMYE